MFTQLNSTAKLYPSFSQLFAFMGSNIKAQGQPTENFFYSAKKQQNSDTSPYYWVITQSISKAITRF